MATTDDMQLLRDYAKSGSEQAFTTLVTRHVSMVHSVALRHVRDPHQAEEITQAVFVILARKAGTLTERTILSGWLFHTARLTASNFLRTEIRRAHREQEAYMQSQMQQNELSPSPQMSPLLDEAIASLSETDRNAIVLRFVEGRDFKELGTALGATEDSGRMRVNRALEKLRAFLARRGVALSAVVIAGVLSANAVQVAPPALIGSVALAVAKESSITASTSTLIKGTLKLMAWTKLKIAALTGVSILLAAGAVTVAVKAAGTTTTNVTVNTTPDSADDKVWALYDQATAQGFSRSAIDAITQVMKSHPPMALLRLTGLKNPGGRGSGGMGTLAGQMEMGTTLRFVVDYAYHIGFGIPDSRIIVPQDLTAARYDYLDTMPQGGPEVLQQALKDKFGIVMRREMRQLDTYVMTVKDPTAAGLKQSAVTRGITSRSGGSGQMTGKNMTISLLATMLGGRLNADVLDQTGLSGGFDYSLNLPGANSSPDQIKQAVLDQLGLELTPSADKHPVEFIVVEKAQ